MKYDMMVLDLDGTLLNSTSRLETETKQVLQKCMREGKKIVLCSSRSFEELRKIADALYEGCTGQYCIGFGGAAGYSEEGRCVVKAEPISSAGAEWIIELAERNHIHIHGYEEDMLYYYRETREFQTFLEFADVSEIPMKKVSYEEFRRRKYLKLMCLGEVERLEWYREKISGYADASFSNPAGQQGYLDILPTGISKGTGVKQLCEYLGIPLENCICVGDGENDIPMLKEAGLGISMKNGAAVVKATADYIVPYTNDEGAAAYLAEKFLL